MVNGPLKEQGIEDIIEPNPFNTGQQDTEMVSNRLILNKVIAKVVISVITIILLKVSIFTSRANMKELDMNVININTNQHARVISLNIIRQSMKKELNMNATCVNTNLHDRVI